MGQCALLDGSRPHISRGKIAGNCQTSQGAEFSQCGSEHSERYGGPADGRRHSAAQASTGKPATQPVAARVIAFLREQSQAARYIEPLSRPFRLTRGCRALGTKIKKVAIAASIICCLAWPIR